MDRYKNKHPSTFCRTYRPSDSPLSRRSGGVPVTLLLPPLPTPSIFSPRHPPPPPSLTSRTQLTLHATHRTPHWASRLVHAMSVWSEKPDVFHLRTVGMRGSKVIRLRLCMKWIHPRFPIYPPPPPPSSFHITCLSGRSHGVGRGL